MEEEAKSQRTSINSLFLKIIEQGIGYRRHGKKTCYHDLDNLAGTWTKEEAKAFEENTKVFESIDKEI